MIEVYLDNCSTTAIRKEVLDKMFDIHKYNYGNPSSLYEPGFINKRLINESRSVIAQLLNADLKDIYFTSGGSESNNWAIKSVAFAKKKGHVIMSSIEHASCIKSAEFLENMGYEISFVKPDLHGRIVPCEVFNKIRRNTILVSVMMVNNETGIIQPIKEIAQLCHQRKVLFHTDAVQAVLHKKVDVKELDVDLLSISGHKMYAPKGVGVLYIKKGTEIMPFISGGHQENGMRAGTENVASIVGMAEGFRLCQEEFEINEKRYYNLRAYIINELQKCSVGFIELGSETKKIDSIINLCFDNIDSKILAMLLADNGVYVSTGSACNSQNIVPSYVLQAMSIPENYINGSIRVSFGKDTTMNEVERFSYILSKLLSEKKDMMNISTSKNMHNRNGHWLK